MKRCCEAAHEIGRSSRHRGGVDRAGTERYLPWMASLGWCVRRYGPWPLVGSAWLSLGWLGGCGQTEDGAQPAKGSGGSESAASGGRPASGGTPATGGTADTGGASSTGGRNEGGTNDGGSSGSSCASSGDGADVALAPLSELPLRLEGSLCGPEDALWATFAGQSEVVPLAPVQVHLSNGAMGAAYTVSLFNVTHEGALLPLTNAHETHVFTLDANTPDLVFRFQDPSRFQNRVVLQLQGPAGPVAIDIQRPTPPPIPSDCVAAYESTPVKTPSRSLPTIIEGELCNARDSRVWAIEVAAGRQVQVTLENPWAIASFNLSVARADVPALETLPLSAGMARGSLGLVSHTTLAFTPEQAGTVALYAGGGISQGEAFRLRVEQE